jgi:hypothetical protein
MDAAPATTAKDPLEVPAALAVAGQVILFGLLGAFILAILVMIARSVVRARRDDRLAEPLADAPPLGTASVAYELAPLSDAEALLARGDAYARVGRLDAALHAYLGASLIALDRRGAVRLRKDRTNGEYVRACSEKSAKPALAAIAREVDEVAFGGRSASDEGVRRAASSAVTIVRNASVAVVALVLAVGCNRAPPPPAGSDPAGLELFGDVMRAQGVEVAPLAGPLAMLPLPKPSALSPTVLVDLERTPIDDETRSHLARWVEAGGVLVLAGVPEEWPLELGVSRTLTSTNDVESLWAGDDAVGPPVAFHATVTHFEGLTWTTAHADLATFGDKTTYAALATVGRGFVLGLAGDELLTNAGIAHPGNAATLAAILARVAPSRLEIARAEGGVSPASNPIAGLARAGVGSGLLHALGFTAILFLAAGVRLTRPRPTAPPARRAFAEHVEATGALYAKTRAAAHALAAYTRFADERLHAKMPRGSTDVPAFLAARSGRDRDDCERVWWRAKGADPAAPPRGDELDVLKELASMLAKAD